jgi:ribonuclease Z
LIPTAFNITFLGTSAASVNLYSPTSTCLVEGGDTRILIDAGIGALRQLHRVHVDPAGIDALLITHWHFDHFAGLPRLLKSRKRSSVLSVYGPRPSILARAYVVGLLQSAHVRFEALPDNSSRDCGDMRIMSVPTDHDIASCGWVLAERAPGKQRAQRRIVISGDTRPTPAIISAARGADLLVHEATYLDKQATRAYTHQHSTVAQAANLAVEARVGALALTHIAHRYSRLSALNEGEKIFPGVLVPSPLDTICIEPAPYGSRREGPGWANLRIGQRREVAYPPPFQQSE